MFGLIRQLAKLITLVKNLPSVITLVPKLLGDPKKIATTLAIGMIGDEIQSITDRVTESLDTSIYNIQNDARERVEDIRRSMERSKKRAIARNDKIQLQEPTCA